MTEFKLSWPPKELSPNVRVHHQALARAKKAYRNACAWEVVAQGGKPMQAEALHITLTFYEKDKLYRRDLDNMLASLKAGLDGLADVLKVDDHKWSLTLLRSPEIGGFVKVRIEEVSTQNG